MELVKTSFTLNPDPFWIHPITKYDTPQVDCVDLFDVNGYNLTKIEQDYAEVNTPALAFRQEKALMRNWYESPNKTEGVHLNHALLLERKAYNEQALEQLQKWSKTLPLLQKILKIRSKWGIDIAIDYVDNEGNAFEVFHYEWDDFNWNKVVVTKTVVQELVQKVDWEYAAKDLLRKKDQWSSLPFFEQSNWKCRYFGIQPEKFKEIIWNEEI